MAKKTLLELVQDILSATDGDEVNSISDTIEAGQVATIVKQCYFDIIDEHDLPVNGAVVNLTGLADTAKPTHMKLPDSISKIEWIKYDTRESVSGDYTYSDMVYKDPDEFITFTNSRPASDTTNYQVVMYNADTPIVICKTSAPSFWTSFDDEYIIFDSYNTTVDSTLQTSKNICYGFERPELTIDDDSIPDLPENLFGYLEAQATAVCFSQLKQEVNPKAEQRERRLRIRSQRSKWRQGRMINDDVDYGWK